MNANYGNAESRSDDGWRDAPPRTDDEVADFHLAAAYSLRCKVFETIDAASVIFGEPVAEAIAFGFFKQTNNLHAPGKPGWRDRMDQVDWIDLTQTVRDCLCYGVDGAAPREGDGGPREGRVVGLSDCVQRLLEKAGPFLTDESAWAFHLASARSALDFGKPFTLRDLELLANVGYAAVRNAAASGDLAVAADGTVAHEQGRLWLARRRGFLPSRWLNPDDDQEPISTARRDGDVVQIPQSEDGPFLPETAVRRNRKTGGIHVTIGPKGEEESVPDFFEALDKLARMPTPRWRRRNAVGNWGIVRARGAWLSVPTELVRQQLAAFATCN